MGWISRTTRDSPGQPARQPSPIAGRATLPRLGVQPERPAATRDDRAGASWRTADDSEVLSHAPADRR